MTLRVRYIGGYEEETVELRVGESETVSDTVEIEHDPEDPLKADKQAVDIVVAEEVEPGMIMAWGGWNDWDTFREHYLGAYSPEMEKEQMKKVPWL